jgi:hypothetical protein
VVNGNSVHPLTAKSLGCKVTKTNPEMPKSEFQFPAQSHKGRATDLYLRCIFDVLELGLLWGQNELPEIKKNREHYVKLLLRAMNIDPNDPNCAELAVGSIVNNRRWKNISGVFFEGANDTTLLRNYMKSLREKRGESGTDSEIRKLVQMVPKTIDDCWRKEMPLLCGTHDLILLLATMPLGFEKLSGWLEHQVKGDRRGVYLDEFLASVLDSPTRQHARQWSHQTGFPSVFNSTVLRTKFDEGRRAFDSLGIGKILPQVAEFLETQFNDQLHPSDLQLNLWIAPYDTFDFQDQALVNGSWVCYIQTNRILQDENTKLRCRLTYEQLTANIQKHLTPVQK